MPAPASTPAHDVANFKVLLCKQTQQPKIAMSNDLENYAFLAELAAQYPGRLFGENLAHLVARTLANHCPRPWVILWWWRTGRVRVAKLQQTLRPWRPQHCQTAQPQNPA